VLHARIVTGTGGGPDKTIINSPRFLAGHGIDSTCVFYHPPDDVGFEVLQQRADQAAANLIAIPDPGRFNWSTLRKTI
jgi:hypothetical protein